MARVKFSPIVTNISGSVGGVTFQRNKFGHTMRQKPLPTFTPSVSQLAVRTHMATVQRAWQALTDAQRTQWNRFLDFSGQTIKHDKSVLLTGHTLFLKYQLLRLTGGHTLLATIEYVSMPSVPDFKEFNYVAGTLNFVVLNPIVATTTGFMLKVSVPRPPAKVFSNKGLRKMFVSFSNTDTFNINYPYIEAFGIPPAVGDTLHYSIIWYSSDAPITMSPVTGTAEIQAP